MLFSKRMQMAPTISVYNISVSFSFLSFMQVYPDAARYRACLFMVIYGYHPLYSFWSLPSFHHSADVVSLVHEPSSLLHLTSPKLQTSMVLLACLLYNSFQSCHTFMHCFGRLLHQLLQWVPLNSCTQQNLVSHSLMLLLFQRIMDHFLMDYASVRLLFHSYVASTDWFIQHTSVSVAT